MQKSKSAKVLSKSDLTHSDAVPKWLKQEYQYFQRQVLDPDFPCYFGTIAETKGEIYTTYVNGNDLSTLPDDFRYFLDHIDIQEKRKSLAIFFEPESSEQTLDTYRKRFWYTLDFLHREDEKSWPSDNPQDPDEKFWNFCFHGEPLFVFANTPAYRNRKSRNLGNSMVIMMQSIDVFKGIEPGTPAGAKTRKNIRERLLKFDNYLSHPDMGNPRGLMQRPWKLYFLSDDMNKDKGNCPFHFQQPWKDVNHD